MTDGPVGLVRVGIGLVGRGGAFLVRPRPAGGPLAGLWEFPGGKVEVGETPGESVVRECREEAGLAVFVRRLRRVVRHDYAHASVELSFFDAEPGDDRAEPDGSSGFVWVRASDLPTLAFPAANAPIVAELAGEYPLPSRP